MSFVRAVPELLGTSARNLAGIGSMLSTSNAIAAAPTVAVSAAAGDQVSAAVAAFFNGHAQGYQQISAQAADFHSQFVQSLNAGANTYALAEAANASPMQQPLNVGNDPIKATAGDPITSGNSTTRGEGSAGAGSANGAQQKGGSSRAGGLSSTGAARSTPSTGAADAGGNDRASGLWCGNGGVIRVGGSAAKAGNIALGGPGSPASLLGTAGQVGSDDGNSGGGRSAGVLLRTVGDHAGTESTGGTGGVTGVARDKAGLLFASRSVGGAGGLLNRLVSVSALHVTSGPGGHGGMSSGAGGAGGTSSRGAAGGAGGSAGSRHGSSVFGRPSSFFVAGGAGGRTNLFGFGAGLRPTARRAGGATSDQAAME
jgi:hypothetical protein